MNLQSRSDTNLDVLNDSFAVDFVRDELKCERIVALYAQPAVLSERMIFGEDGLFSYLFKGE